MRITEAIAADLAPRYADGWRAAKALLSDGEWHTIDELRSAIVATGLAERSAGNLMRDLRLDGWVAHRGAGQRREFRIPRTAVD